MKIEIEFDLPEALISAVREIGKIYNRPLSKVVLNWTEFDLENFCRNPMSFCSNVTSCGWTCFESYNSALDCANQLKAKFPFEEVVIDPYDGGYFVGFGSAFLLEAEMACLSKDRTTPSEYAERL